jgi:hypothetical protein
MALPGGLAFPSMRGDAVGVPRGGSQQQKELANEIAGLVARTGEMHVLQAMQASVDRQHRKGRVLLAAELSSQWKKRQELVRVWDGWCVYHVRTSFLLRRAKRNLAVIRVTQALRRWHGWLLDKRHRKLLQERLTKAVLHRAIRNCLLFWAAVRRLKQTQQRLADKVLGRSPIRRLREAFRAWKAAAHISDCCSWRTLRKAQEEQQVVEAKLKAVELQIERVRATGGGGEALRSQIGSMLTNLRQQTEHLICEREKSKIGPARQEAFHLALAFWNRASPFYGGHDERAGH